MKLLIVFTALVWLNISFSQSGQIEDERDSLKGIEKRFQDSKSDIERVELLTEFYVYYHTLDSDSAMHYAQKAYDLAEKINHLEGQIRSATNIGSVHFYNGSLGNALQSYIHSNKLVEKYLDKTKENEFSQHHLSKNLNNIGLIYLNQGDYEEAERYLLQSLAIDEKLGNKITISNCYHNLGTVKESQGDYEEAIKFYTKAYNIKVSEKNTLEIPSTLINIGVVRMNEGSFYQADTCFQAAIDYSKRGNNSKDLCLAYINLGDLHFIQKDFDRAISNYFLAVDICEEHNYLYFLNYAYESVSLAYQEMNNYKGAYEYLTLYNETMDSINSEENRILISELQTKFETENKEKEIVLLNKEKDLKNIELENSKTILIFTVVGLGIISVFLVLLFISFKQKKKINAEINRKNDKLERAYVVVEEKNKEILDSITYAKRIQNAILPTSKLVKEYLPNSFILYKPKDIVAGDFYWLEHKEGKLLFAAADCTGHGVPGALVSVFCNNGLNRSVREYGLTDPGKILDKTREIVISEFEKSEEEVKDGMDISICSLDLSSNNLLWSGANNPLWIIRKDELLEIKPDKQPIGVIDNPTPFTTHQISLQKGDNIYIFTDGFQDQFGGDKGKKYKPANFKNLLLSISNKSMEQQRAIIDDTFNNWKGNLDQLDDVCIIGVKV
mgnify:CR=1 FL=1